MEQLSRRRFQPGHVLGRRHQLEPGFLGFGQQRTHVGLRVLMVIGEFPRFLHVVAKRFQRIEEFLRSADARKCKEPASRQFIVRLWPHCA